MNAYGSIAQRLAALCLASVLATILHGGEMVPLGTHPTSAATAFPGIHVLKAYQGRIYMGYGDWNSYPAVVVASYDPGTASFRPEYSAPTDSVGTFRVVRGDLYVPSIDPVHFEEFADLSVRSGGVWRRYAPAGFFHVFDVATLTGDDLWFVGAKSANETSTVNAAVWRSLDDGRTWTDVTIASPEFRYYYSFPLRGKFYVHDTVYDGTGATRVAAAPYQLFYKPLPLGSGTNEIVVGRAQLTPGIGGSGRASLVRYDTLNWQSLKANVIDLAIAESLLYTLDYNPASRSNELWVAAFNQQMQPTWMQLPLSNIPANAKAIEVLGDRIYVGGTDGQLWVGEIDGSPASISSTTIVNELRDGFGRAIVTDATSLAIGSPEFSGDAIMSGRVTVWTRTRNGSGASSWTDPQTIVPPQPSFSGWFGKDVAIENGVLAILEAGTDLTGEDRGRAAQVHLYESTAQGWQFRQTIVNTYAHALALKSNVLWVATSTLLHRYAVGLGTNGITATLAQSFSSGAPVAMYQPAARVAADTNRVAFGVTGDFSRAGGPGQVNIYEQQEGVWRRVSTLLQNSAPLPPGLAYHPDAFGFAVALAGDWLAVGAPRDDAAARQAGAVHLYQRVVNGTNISYVQRQKIVGPLSQQEANFGTSVAFAGDYLVIGAPGIEQASNRRRGAVHVYRLEGTNAVSVGSVPAPAGSETEFGTKVFLDGDTIIAGSRTSTTNANELERVLFRKIGDLAAWADLSLAGSVTPAQAGAGTLVQYTIIVSNAGPSNATSAVLVFDKPTNASITSISVSSGSWSNGTAAITWALGDLFPGGTAELNITADPTFATLCEVMRARATVTASGFDTNLHNNEVNLAVNDFPPAVSITSPADGATVRFGSTIQLAAAAVATNGVTSVNFYTNGGLLGTVAASPYTLSWSNLSPGIFNLMARVTDGCGLVRTSTPVRLFVSSNATPSVTIVAPLDRTRFAETNGIRISIAAADSDGTIAEVKLYLGTNLLTSFSSAPYDFIWNNAPTGTWTLRATTIDNDGTTNISGSVLVVVGTHYATGTNWTAYNDHGAGPATHVNATRWDIWGHSPGASGPLKDIINGTALPVSVAITRTTLDATVTSGGVTPTAGSPAAQVFVGYVAFGPGTNQNVPVSASQSVTYSFSELNPSRQYSLKMTAVRGIPSYTNRWTLLQLNDAQSFRATHTAGCLTQGFGTISANQVALNTGFNTAGALASWDEIVPAADGTFAVMCTQYTGPLPGGGTGSTEPYGYVPTVFRLQDTAALPPPLITNLPVTQTVSPGAVPSFSADALGDGSLAYQWFYNDTPMAGATNATFSLPPVVSANAGHYTVRVSSPGGQTTSQPAVLTLFSIHPSRQLEISGPVGQAYRIDARTDFSQTNGWITVTNLVLPSSPFLFSDPGSSNAPQRFYRAIAVQ